MGLGKPQRLHLLLNFKRIFFKNWNKPKWGSPLLFAKTDFTVGFSDPMLPIRCATVVELRLEQHFTKNRILQWKILNFGRL